MLQHGGDLKGKQNTLFGEVIFFSSQRKNKKFIFLSPDLWQDILWTHTTDNADPGGQFQLISKSLFMNHAVQLLECLGAVRPEIGVGKGENQVSSHRNFHEIA